VFYFIDNLGDGNGALSFEEIVSALASDIRTHPDASIVQVVQLFLQKNQEAPSVRTFNVFKFGTAVKVDDAGKVRKVRPNLFRLLTAKKEAVVTLDIYSFGLFNYQPRKRAGMLKPIIVEADPDKKNPNHFRVTAWSVAPKVTAEKVIITFGVKDIKVKATILEEMTKFGFRVVAASGNKL